MSDADDKGFLKRWSRKKRAETPLAGGEPAEKPPSNLPPRAGEGLASLPPPRGGGGPVGATPPAGPSKGNEEEAIDPATLPPIESLGRDSDYTVFLRKGVPEALRIAALRRAWMTDPFIRDFRSPAIDYGWDFTTPDYSLRAGDDVAKLVDQIFGAPAPGPAPGPAPEYPPAAAPSIPPPVPPPAPSLVAPAADLTLPHKGAAAVPDGEAQQARALAPKSSRRRHGGALPDRDK